MSVPSSSPGGGSTSVAMSVITWPWPTVASGSEAAIAGAANRSDASNTTSRRTRTACGLQGLTARGARDPSAVEPLLDRADLVIACLVGPVAALVELQHGVDARHALRERHRVQL